MRRLNLRSAGLWVLAVFFALSLSLYAQDSSNSSSSDSSNSSSSSSSSSSTFSLPSSIKNSSFLIKAKQLTSKLAGKVGLSDAQLLQIGQVLYKYRNDIASIYHKAVGNGQQDTTQSGNQNQDATGSSSGSSSGASSRVDTTGILGNNVSQYYAGASPDAMSDYRQADQNADKKIQNVLSNDTQKSRYDQSKGQWWNDVKDAVFSTLSPNSK